MLNFLILIIVWFGIRQLNGLYLRMIPGLDRLCILFTYKREAPYIFLLNLDLVRCHY